MTGKHGLRGLPVLVLLASLLALAMPAAASALTFEIVNESGRSPEEVWVTVAGEPGTFEVPGVENDVPVQLSSIPGQTLTIDKLVSGRIYVSYGAGVTVSVPFDSPTRFDWAELTVTPASSDVANLTAVDQFGIGMRLDTFNAADQHLEAVGAANSNTIFNALQQIPGGPQATIRNGSEILRVLSPNQSDAYPDLGEYVRSMSGQTITLHTAYYGAPFTTSSYSGTFAADGSLTLSGTTDPPGMAPATISFSGPQLIDDVYTGANTPNDAEGAIRRDVLAGFSTGLWGGRYGNDALGFCSDPVTTVQGSWCPSGFNQPAFGDARASLSPFPTCEQYAAVINEFSDVYGNPYSDASKKVTVGLDQPGSGGEVTTLQLTIQPDSGNAQPVAGGNSNCGAAPPAQGKPGGTATTTTTPSPKVAVRFLAKAKVRGRTAKVGRVSCGGPCGQVKVIARKGRRVVGRMASKGPSARRPLKLRLTEPGARLVHRKGRLKVRLRVLVTPPGGRTVARGDEVVLLG